MSTELLIADEPTTALDVTVQPGILRLLNRLRERLRLSIILITHDLRVMSSIADQLHIFYAGRVVESGPRREILSHPRHPYTAALLASMPHPETATKTPLVSIARSAPSASNRPRLRAPSSLPVRPGFVCGDKPSLISIQAQERRQLACPVDPYLRSG